MDATKRAFYPDQAIAAFNVFARRPIVIEVERHPGHECRGRASELAARSTGGDGADFSGSRVIEDQVDRGAVQQLNGGFFGRKNILKRGRRGT